MLSRDAILSGAYLKAFEDLPGQTPWAPERIQASIDRTLAERPGTGPIWMFAYGSLMWNPMLEVARREIATLHGWHRSFCLNIAVGRGSPLTPGRMLALETGGTTQGVALQLDTRNLDEDLRVVWTREMILGSYRPIWAPITLLDGAKTSALVFVADPTHFQYEDDSRAECIAPLIARAEGKLGTNREYVVKLDEALREKGLSDEYVRRVKDMVLTEAAAVTGTLE